MDEINPFLNYESITTEYVGGQVQKLISEILTEGYNA